MRWLTRVMTDDRGATAIEYALIAALISLSMVIAFNSLGLNLSDIFTSIAETLRGRAQ